MANVGHQRFINPCLILHSLLKKISRIFIINCFDGNHTGQCKRTGGCYNELVVAFYSTGGGVKGKKIYTC